MSNMSYGIQLLDDLHAYFPDLLYNSGRFRSIQDILLYIREVAMNQSPFHVGYVDYIRRNPSASLAPSTTPPHTPPSTPPIQANTASAIFTGYSHVNNIPPPPPAPVNANAVNANAVNANAATAIPLNTQRAVGLSDYLRYIPLLSALNSIPTITIPDDLSINLLNPDFDITSYLSRPIEHNAITRPTQRQINAATTISASLNGDETCAICQEDIETGSQIRKINSCRHAFHKSCIDVWFDRSVCCPVCRIDIRDNLYGTDTYNPRNAR